MFAVPTGGTYSPPQTLLLDLSGPLGGEGKATWSGEGRGRKERERGDRKAGGVAVAPIKKFLRAPTLQFITKLVYRWKASHRDG